MVLGITHTSGVFFCAPGVRTLHFLCLSPEGIHTMRLLDRRS
nr:MAG TPA: hypothetical protein [Caudoviricetes sp.]